MATSINPAILEAPLQPDLAICDAHHHLRERADNRYLLEEFSRDVGTGHNIVSTIAVECGVMYRKEGPEELMPVGETEFLDSMATQAALESNPATQIAAAIVAYADLTLGDQVAPILEVHLNVSPGRLRGIRCSTTWDADFTERNVSKPGLLLDSTFQRGIRLLGQYDLSFDAWLFHSQLSELADLAGAFPQVTIILDHMAGPLGIGPYAGKRDEVFRNWSRDIAKVANYPNVAVKLGGVGSTRSGYDWHERAVQPLSAELAQAMAPYFEFCIERFGVHRCMFESNFPVDKASYSYSAVWNAFKRITQTYSTAECQALFHDTAARVYRLTPEEKKS